MKKVEGDLINQPKVCKDKPYWAEIQDILEYYPEAKPLLRELENFDHYTFQHSLRAEAFARTLAGELGFSEEDQRVFRLAALMHDVGKLIIDKKIINDPHFDPLRDLKKMRHHVTDGFKKVYDICPDAAEIILRHHSFQKYFYPSDEEMRIISKINDPVELIKIERMANYLSLIDNFEAHSGDRPEKGPEPLEKFLPEIKERFRSKNDEKAIEILVKALEWIRPYSENICGK